MNMEHLHKKWAVLQYGDDWCVVTDEPSLWYVCTVSKHLDDDPTGESTARAICREHNAEIERKGA